MKGGSQITEADRDFVELVLSVLGAHLSKERFQFQIVVGGVRFERELRGYSNAILIDQGNPQWSLKLVRFSLYAPNFPNGAEGMVISNGRLWWEYETHADLESVLVEMRSILLGPGLKWFDENTPPDGPTVADVLSKPIGAMMETLGFTGQLENPSTVPNVLRFTRSAGVVAVVAIDCRRQGKVTVVCSMKRGEQWDRKTGPEFDYSVGCPDNELVEGVVRFLTMEIPKLLVRA